ncbi:MAG: hypothetical protein V2I46_03285 [Bacteroides sp.]|nr:hypothetical protein [Bacteroides sp.]
MKRFFAFLAIIILFGILPVYSQDGSGIRSRNVFAGQHEHVLDTLSILPGSFTIHGPDKLPLDSAFFTLDAPNARLSLRVPEYWQNDSLKVWYRVFPILLTAPYSHKDPEEIFAVGDSVASLPFALTPALSDEGLIGVSGLQSTGSITRGITVGNRQDLSLQSAMNLQLNGNLSESIEVNALISDQDIPFQPDGTTRQIQEFDKVFIQLSGLGGHLTAGDFTLERPEGYFLNFNRRAQGGMGSYSTKAHGEGLLGGAQVDITVAGAIAKGKYVRNQLQAVEGNQGPYKLSGANNESFIIIIAGTERVFIDGELLIRGMDYDYVIDYNMAELTFTTRRMITRESRIVVEFEYAERNYARSVLYSGTRVSNEKGGLYIHFFSEQDHKNQSLFQELTDERIARMAAAGDSLQQAFDWNVDSTGFFNDRVMYLMTDTLGYDSVFVYSTDPQRAFYRPGFSFVGEGQGNYIQVNAAANGRVFQWVAPMNGQRQGTHEPIIQLVTPKKAQMLTIGGDYKISQHTTAGLEFALSNHDLNLFSDRDQQDDMGFGLLLKFDHKRPLPAWGDGKWTFGLTGSHELASTHFNPVERYRSVEFERDWNLENNLDRATENNTNLGIELMHPQSGMAKYQFRSFQQGPQYSGFMNKADSRMKFGAYRFFYQGSLLNSKGIQKTDFYRHHTGLNRRVWFFTAGIEHQMEDNRRRTNQTDSLMASSVYFDEWQFFLSQPDSARNQYRIYYQQRKDRKPFGNAFSDDAQATEAGFTYELLNNPDQRVLLNLNHRSLALSGQAADNTFGGRFDYFSSWIKGAVVSSLFYEAGSGMERKREYIYLEVPTGQGVYSWVDYNGNGIMELDEFELAQFPDQANFIRVFIPTDDFTKVFSTRYSHTLTIDPRQAWRDESGIKGLLSRFSNQTSVRIEKKEQGEVSFAQFSPFLTDVADTAVVGLNSLIRNSLFFNRSGGKLFVELTWQDSRNKMLLSNGFESRVNKSTSLRTRWNLNRNISAEVQASLGDKENFAAFFFNRNYRIESYALEPVVSYQHENRWRLSLFYGYADKENIIADLGEKARIHKGGLEMRYSIPGKGNLTGKFQLSNIDFPFDLNTPIAFEMLEGLSAGTNNLWNLSWQQNLNAWLQLNVTYHGRKSEGIKAVHSGSMQVRALF